MAGDSLVGLAVIARTKRHTHRRDRMFFVIVDDPVERIDDPGETTAAIVAQDLERDD